MKKYNVTIEWADGKVTDEIISEKMWTEYFEFFYRMLEGDENIEQYSISTIE